ncbi:hypothetical protein CEXT_87631 [Caerostris extrusa]|uniref:Uncharacterized protein n=1 Tax=Caerostris extrusa TaxID=172846 RepID=A0AAV4Y161_CAEEX|nr:hypothetical protein CEXT_87631 [Caerostris extrusa]
MIQQLNFSRVGALGFSIESEPFEKDHLTRQSFCGKMGDGEMSLSRGEVVKLNDLSFFWGVFFRVEVLVVLAMAVH